MTCSTESNDVYKCCLSIYTGTLILCLIPCSIIGVILLGDLSLDLNALCAATYQSAMYFATMCMYEMTPVHVHILVSYASFDWRRAGGVYWISSFVMEYSFLWLSALSDHADSHCIECDSRTMHLTHRLMPLWLRWRTEPRTKLSVGSLDNSSYWNPVLFSQLSPWL